MTTRPEHARRRATTGRPSLAMAALAITALAAMLPLAACEREPQPLTNPHTISVESPFHYPLDLWDRRVEGETVVMVYVTDMGAVDSVYVLEPSGEAAFDSAAVEGARNLKFAPGRRGDERIAMWARLPVRFSRPDSTHSGAMP